MTKIFLIFSHKLTDVQVKDVKEVLSVDDFVYLPDNLQNIWSQILPYGELPISELNKIIDWIKVEANKNDYILVQGDFGATYYMVNWAFKSGLIPIYATTERVVLEENKEGDRVVKKNIFRHVNFRRYVAFE